MSANPYKRYLNTKRATSKSRGVSFDLDLKDLYQLLSEAGIDISQVGKTKGSYVLGRYNDEGPYSLENCRFITAEQNHRERRVTNLGISLSKEHREKISKSNLDSWSNDSIRKEKLRISNSENPRRKTL